MFLADLPPVPYSDPWDIPLPQRLKMLMAGEKRVAYFYESANNSTFRYRAYNMVQLLNDEAVDGCCGSFFFQEDLHRIEEIADAADVLVICRSGYSDKINRLILKFRVRGKRVYFDIDDLVFDTTQTHLVISTLGLDEDDPRVWDDWFAMMGRMGQTLRMCDGAITTNDYLATRISAFCGLPVKVVPNFMNREQIDLSVRLFEAKQSGCFARDATIHLGYFSGSPSHRLDFAIVRQALESVLESDPRTRLVVVGYIDPGPSFSGYGDRVIYRPFQDYVNLQRVISRVEFNLMPLQSNTFTHCKSPLKYFEAAIVGTLSIASPSHNYSAVMEDGENGYVARAHQWSSVIRRAIANMERYPEMARRAHADALTKHAWLNKRGEILQALGFQ